VNIAALIVDHIDQKKGMLSNYLKISLIFGIAMVVLRIVCIFGRADL